jgi:hypothetical protein
MSSDEKIRNPEVFPVLIIAFNRPENLAKCLDALKIEKCSNIYVSIDGPRNDFDRQKQIEIDLILNQFALRTAKNLIIKKNERNLGCAQGVVTAIDWFFLHENAGIILEDDLILSPEYFNFLSSVLEKEKNEEVAVTAYAPFQIENPISNYWKSRYLFISGWYISSKMWRTASSNLTKSRKPYFKSSDGTHRAVNESLFWWSARMKVLFGFTDTWDCLFFEEFWRNSFNCVVPNSSFVVNTGFDAQGTHTQDVEDDLQRKFHHRYGTVREMSDLDKVVKSLYFQIRLKHYLTPPISLCMKVFSQFLFESQRIKEQEIRIRSIRESK